MREEVAHRHDSTISSLPLSVADDFFFFFVVVVDVPFFSAVVGGGRLRRTCSSPHSHVESIRRLLFILFVKKAEKKTISYLFIFA